MKPIVNIGMHEGQVKVTPSEFFGPALFKVYREACRNSGCAFNPKLNANFISIDLLPSLLKRIEIAFTPIIDLAVAQAAKDRASGLDLSRLEAKTRVSQLKDQPYPFQVKGIEFLASRTTAILGDEMGLGKTVQALLAIPDGYGVNIVCPASLKGNWLKETQRWRPDLKPSIDDSFFYAEPGEVRITNYERLPSFENPVAIKGNFDWEKLILVGDECQYLKSAKSKRTVKFRAIAKMIRALGGRTYGLSGTPMPSSPMDLLNVLQAFDLLGQSFGNWPRFINLFNGKQDYWGKWNWGQPKPEAIEALQRVMLRRLRKDVLPDLPVMTYQDIEVDIPAAARRASDAARAAMEAAGVNWEDIVSGKTGFGAASESVFTARRLLAEAKIPAMLEIVEDYESQQEPLVIFSAHRTPIESLAARKSAAILGDIEPDMRTRIVADFQSAISGNTIGLTIKAGGVGFTLTRAAHALFVDQEWTPAENQQAAARICRIGQTRGVLIKRLIAPDTIDGDLQAILDRKQAAIDATIDKTEGQSVQATPEELRSIK